MADIPLISILDIALRGGAVTGLLLLAGFLLRDAGRTLAGRLGAGFALGAAAFAASSAGGIAAQPPIWLAPVLALSIGNNVVFWLFARTLFDDDFRLRPWHAAPWAVVTAIGLLEAYWLRFTPLGAGVGLGLRLAAILFAGLGVVRCLATWRADLVEERRRVRLLVVGGSAVYIVAFAGTGIVWGCDLPAALALMNAAALLAMTLLTAWRLIGLDSAGLLPPPPLPLRAGSRAGADPHLLAALTRLMEEERVHRQEGLTIGSLAGRLDVTEHRLRRLINQGLGYRNFNAFLNRCRIGEARAALADPAQVKVPILTIALDAGFQSLGPFNRAFKAETGMTPTEYRRLHGGGLPADSEIGEAGAASASHGAASASVPALFRIPSG